MILPILIMIYLNSSIDPANLFSDYEKEVAKIQISGLNAIATQNFNERAVKVQYIEMLNQPNEVIALGSSRIMGLSSEIIGNSNFYNSGVSGAGIYDIKGLVGSYSKNQLLPHKIIVGIDPWMFNINNGDTRYKELQEEIDYFNNGKLEMIKIDPKYLELCSPAYLQSAVDNIKKEGFQPKPRPMKSAANENHERTFCSDGSLSYGLSFRNTTSEQASAAAQQSIKGNVYQLSDFNQISEQYRNEFDLLIMYLLDEEVQIYFYLAPFHPIVYEHFKTTPKYKNVIEVERFINEYASTHGIELYGSYDPKITGCTETDFLDGMHLRTDKNTILKSFHRKF